MKYPRARGAVNKMMRDSRQYANSITRKGKCDFKFGIFPEPNKVIIKFYGSIPSITNFYSNSPKEIFQNYGDNIKSYTVYYNFVKILDNKFYESGSIKSSVVFFENGKINIVKNYYDKNLETRLNKNNLIKSSLIYENGLKSRWYSYCKNGHITKEVIYDKKESIEKISIYKLDGKLSSVVRYVNCKKDTMENFSKEGKLISRYRYIDNKKLKVL